ncbi:MAG: M10 family metallopeptidase [Pseudomonadota bacterium]
MSGVRGVQPASSLAVNALLGGYAFSGALTYGFIDGVPASTGATIIGASPATFALKDAVDDAFAAVEAFTKLDLDRRQTGQSADIEVITADRVILEQPTGPVALELGAYAVLPSPGPLSGTIFIGRELTYGLSPGGFGFRAVLHEVGHALGLKQPDEPGPFAVLPASLDGPELSVMSGRSFEGAPLSDGLGFEPDGFAQTYMPADIAALQHLYGANYSNKKNTTYRFDPDERVMLLTIWDGGGTDTYDFSDYTTDLAIDLTPGNASTTGQEPQLNRAQELSDGDRPLYADGAIHNAFLYNNDRRSLIENAKGGQGDDTIIGNTADNRLEGRLGADWMSAGIGDDKLFGALGEDTLRGGDGTDHLAGGRGDDQLFGGRGADTLFGALGADDMNGGNGPDRLDAGYGRDSLRGEAGDDTLIGGNNNDWLHGGQGNDCLMGQNNDDVLIGGQGKDTLIGGRGDDTLTGGKDQDLFVITGTGTTTITDFSRQDLIDVDAPHRAFKNAKADGRHVIITLDDDQVIELKNFNIDALSRDDFL